MNSYRVSWSIDVEANSPIDAAEKALEIQSDATSTANVFEVFGPGCPLDGLEVDLDEINRLAQENANPG